MPIFINYGSIKGDAAPTNTKRQWIEIDSFQWGVERGTTYGTGSAADREGSPPSVTEIVVTKPQVASLTNVNILNSLGPPPNSHRQPNPKRPGKGEPFPPWLKNVLIQLRPYMAPGGTIHISGFQFDDKELSRLAGVTVRPAP